MTKFIKNRQFMFCPDFSKAMTESDQQKGVPHPPHSKKATGELICLPAFESVAAEDSYSALLDTRRSKRDFIDKPVSQEQLAFILWSAQGIQAFRGVNNAATIRPAPSGGARHPFELYAAVKNIVGLKAGLYRYLPLENTGKKEAAVEYLGAIENYDNQLEEMLYGQKWAVKAPVVLFFSCVPYRAEWRYAENAHRVMLIDLGHTGQNVMLSAKALGLDSCCVAAYNQAVCDKQFGFNGIDEYTVYAIPLGFC